MIGQDTVAKGDGDHRVLQSRSRLIECQNSIAKAHIAKDA